MKNKVSPVHVTEHPDGKLQGLSSISTSSAMNPFCLAMQKEERRVCHDCYTKKPYLKGRHGLQNAIARNFEYLTTHEMTDIEAQMVPIYTLYCRFESMGEVHNVTHAKNYVRIAKTHPGTVFVAWSKRLPLYEMATKELGIPPNLMFIESSPFKNWRVFSPSSLASHVFTVYEKDYANNNEVEINCGGCKCMECLQCYRKGEPFYINELLK